MLYFTSTPPPPTATSLQWPVFSVPKETIMERFNCCLFLMSWYSGLTTYSKLLIFFIFTAYLLALSKLKLFLILHFVEIPEDWWRTFESNCQLPWTIHWISEDRPSSYWGGKLKWLEFSICHSSVQAFKVVNEMNKWITLPVFKCDF